MAWQFWLIPVQQHQFFRLKVPKRHLLFRLASSHPETPSVAFRGVGIKKYHFLFLEKSIRYVIDFALPCMLSIKKPLNAALLGARDASTLLFISKITAR